MTSREALTVHLMHHKINPIKNEIVHTEEHATARGNELYELGFNVCIEQLNLLAWKITYWLAL